MKETSAVFSYLFIEDVYLRWMLNFFTFLYFCFIKKKILISFLRFVYVNKNITHFTSLLMSLICVPSSLSHSFYIISSHFIFFLLLLHFTVWLKATKQTRQPQNDEGRNIEQVFTFSAWMCVSLTPHISSYSFTLCHFVECFTLSNTRSLDMIPYYCS